MPTYRCASGVSAANEKPRPLMQKMIIARYSGEYGDRAPGTANATMPAYASARTVATAADRPAGSAQHRRDPAISEATVLAG